MRKTLYQGGLCVESNPDKMTNQEREAIRAKQWSEEINKENDKSNGIATVLGAVGWAIILISVLFGIFDSLNVSLMIGGAMSGFGALAFGEVIRLLHKIEVNTRKS